MKLKTLSLMVLAFLVPPLGFAAGQEAFTEAFLRDDENVERGREIWQERCSFCHGRASYGKAPRLKPSRYHPQFVYNRVTEGFRGMPSFKDEYSEEERRAVVAYVLSEEFTP